MGAKTSKGNPDHAKVQGKKLIGSRVRSTSMPDMPNATDASVSFAPSGGKTKERFAMKRASHDHVLVSRKRTPPPDYHRNPEDVHSGYLTTTDQMVRIWPSYEYLRHFDLRDVELEIVEKITQVFRHLLDQRELIQTLSADNKRVNTMLREYREEQRRTMPVKVDRRDSGETPHKRSSTLSSHGPSELMRNDPTLDPKMKLMAEVQKMRDQALKSSSKRKSIETPSNESLKLEGTNSTAMQKLQDQQQIEELTAKVKALQDELISEKKKRLPSVNNDSPPRLSHPNPFTSKSASLRVKMCEQIKQEYARLDKLLMTELKAELDGIHRSVDDKTKYQIGCAIMMESWRTCKKYREKLEKALKSALLHPTKDCSRISDDNHSKELQSASVLQNISKFESAGQSVHKEMDPIRQCVVEDVLPPGLHRDALAFVASISEHMNFKPIMKEVTSNLKTSHSKFVTDSLIAGTTFKKFLTDCCRVAWNMCVIEHPLRLESTQGVEFCDEFHTPFRCHSLKNAKVDYFLWPVLFDDSDSPSVLLGKGRVALLKGT